jgi:hypothetical protein
MIEVLTVVSNPSRDITLCLRSSFSPPIFLVVVVTKQVDGLGRPWPSIADRRVESALIWV